MSRVHHTKCRAGQITSWNQDCQRTVSNFRYADDTMLVAESKEKLESLLMKAKEESEKTGLKLNIPLTLLVGMQTSTATMENSGDFLKNWKYNFHMTQQSHFWAYTPRKSDLKETCAPQCSLQHCLP